MLMLERDLLRKIDRMILDASPAELKKIQDLDRREQLNGVSFCDTWANYKGRRVIS